MKKIAVLVAIAMMASTTSYADVFGPRPERKLKAPMGIAGESWVEPGTILDGASQIVGYLGTREGTFYDFKEEEFVNYLAATLYTEPNTGIALSVGMLNVDGVAASVDYNVGSHIPAEDVPIMNLVEYLYVGAGVGARHLEQDSGVEDWQLAYGLTAQFKFTF